MTYNTACLVLADGTVFEGVSIGAQGEAVGELVFNTSMTGYQEILSDPSYAQQIIILTASHIGNTGCNAEDMESTRAWASGLVIRNNTIQPSNYRSQYSLSDWLKKQGVVAIAGIDTRRLTLLLREQGAINACITTFTDKIDRAKEKAAVFLGLKGQDLAKGVSRKTIERWHKGRGEWASCSVPHSLHVVVYDFGVKQTILNILYDLGCHITIVPAQTPAQEVLALNPQGVLLSNGPGDPDACHYAIEATRVFLEKNMPLMGICLGVQILGLACGAKTIKMKFGHHGANHPVIETSKEKRVFITSQNHGFTIDESTLPDCLEVTHRSLFDNSIQGIQHRKKQAFGFQGHPEAGPGPHDIEHIITQFVTVMKRR